MKTLVDQLSQYAQYHRDRRNIFSHFIGIPLIVVAVAVLLSRPGFELAGLWLSPALLTALAAGVYYLRLDVRFGLLMAALLALSLWAGAALAVETTQVWLSGGLGLFVVGWIIQFIGHYYEGRKPAFVDDLMGLVVGPLFVVAELAFLLGLRDEVRIAVEERAGPTCIREKKALA
ncbi:MAG TPA: Mpo1-like protein [Pseudomonas sp.]|nr:Mpo1-like protein [Pseudomonas sp.]